MEHVARLIEEAWDRRHRRYRLAILGLLLIGGATIAGLALGRSGSPTLAPTGVTYRPESSKRVVAHTVLQFVPDQALGARCAVLNSLACDSVTIQLFLRSPAVSVVASVYGRTMTLERGDHYPPLTQLPGSFLTTTRAGTAFSGRLYPSTRNLAGVTRQKVDQGGPWHGRVAVRLRVLYRDGTGVSTSYRSTSQRAWFNVSGT